MPSTRCYLHHRIMRSMRHRAARLVGALLMVALLIVPAIASAHTHRDLDAVRSCATCVAAHHSPAIAAPAVGAAAAILAAVAPLVRSPVAPAHPHRSPRAGRAPPSPDPVSVA
jgi:hypothetical protein